MKYLYMNKYWSVNKEYNIDKLLYLMVDRPNTIISFDDNEYIWKNNENYWNRNYDLPSYAYQYISNNTCNLHWHKNSKLYRKNNRSAIIYRSDNKYKTK